MGGREGLFYGMRGEGGWGWGEWVGMLGEVDKKKKEGFCWYVLVGEGGDRWVVGMVELG